VVGVPRLERPPRIVRRCWPRGWPSCRLLVGWFGLRQAERSRVREKGARRGLPDPTIRRRGARSTSRPDHVAWTSL